MHLAVSGQLQPQVNQAPFTPAGPRQQAVVAFHRPQRVQDLLRLDRRIDRRNHGNPGIAGPNVPGQPVAKGIPSIGLQEIAVELRLNLRVAPAADLHLFLHIAVACRVQGEVTHHAQQVRQHGRRSACFLPCPRPVGEELPSLLLMGFVAYGADRIGPERSIIKQDIRSVLSDFIQRPVRLDIPAHPGGHPPPDPLSEVMVCVI